MPIILTNEEKQFLSNIAIDRFNDAARRETEGLILTGIMNKMNLSPVLNLTAQEVGFLQFICHELNEIHGARHSTANEKGNIGGPGTLFIPHNTLVLVKSISDKLGSHLMVDIATKSDQNSPRGEGSTWIMTDPTQKPICG